jgi:hypothetical protein
MADTPKKQRHMNWNALTERQFDAIGKHMQAISEKLQDDIYPIADLRWKGGWRASVIVEASIERVERDLKQITLEMWTRLVRWQTMPSPSFSPIWRS